MMIRHLYDMLLLQTVRAYLSNVEEKVPGWLADWRTSMSAAFRA